MTDWCCVPHTGGAQKVQRVESWIDSFVEHSPLECWESGTQHVWPSWIIRNHVIMELEDPVYCYRVGWTGLSGAGTAGMVPTANAVKTMTGMSNSERPWWRVSAKTNVVAWGHEWRAQ